MNILITANAVTTESNRVTCSGSNVRVSQLGRLFSKWGHDLRVLTTRSGAEAFAPCFKADYLLTVRDKRKRHPLASFLFNFLFSLPHLFVGKPVELLYASSDLFPDALFGLLYKWMRPKSVLVVGCHCLVRHPKSNDKSAVRSSLHGLYAYYSQHIILSLIKRWADLILVSNRMDRQRLVERGLPKAKLMVAHGAPEAEAIPVEPMPPGQRTYDIVFVGNDHPVKGIDHLADALHRVIASRPETRICLIGDLDRLKAKLEAFPHVRFAGIRQGMEKYALLSRSKLLLLTSHTESFSMVACEAVSCGTPVVAFDIPMLRSIYTSGMTFVSYLDSAAMARQVLHLLDDPAELERLSKAAKTFSTRFSWNTPGSALINHVRHLRI